MLGVRLQRARKASGLSLRDLASQVGLSHVAIKKYEDGLSMPSSDTVLKLARACGVRSAYFFRPETLNLARVEYRKRVRMSKKHLEAITHSVIDQVERRLELENLFPDPPVREVVPVEGIPDPIETGDVIEEVAEAVRTSWNLGLGPISDLIDVLENNGLRVFTVDTRDNPDFDGLSARVGTIPIVVVGKHWPGDRQRFTLAHELGHILLEGRIGGELNLERACNRFAGAFLFPRESVRRELGARRQAIEIKELSLLKQAFGISMSGVLFRAVDLGIVSGRVLESQMRTFRFRGWHRQEPGPQIPAEPDHVVEQLLFRALAEEWIGESKAAELMNLPLDVFRQIRALEPVQESAIGSPDQ